MSETSIAILLAEDNPGDAYLVRLALEQTGVNFTLKEVSDGEEAMRYLDLVEAGETAGSPSFVLLDLNLPRFDGKSILERLKSIPRCSTARTIVLTSSEYPADRADVERLGADCYFHKPQDLESFLLLGDLVLKMIQEKRSAGAV